MHSEALEATERYSASKSTHPRVSLQSMKAKIVGEYYTTADKAFGDGVPICESMKLLTICILVMQNGFTVIGKSAPASPENFDEDKGRTFAYEDAIKQLWPLEGYALRDRLASAPPATIPPGDGMKRFVGTKAVNAMPMTRGDYNRLRGWALPEDENGDDEGYLIEYADGQRPNVEGFQGYVSWSPNDVFERAYQPS